MIKGIIFDYGGTIDSRGVHWSEVIWQGYVDAKMDVSKEEFRQSYVFAERALAKHPYIQPEHNFLDLLTIKCDLETQDLVNRGVWLVSDTERKIQSDAVANYCYQYVLNVLEVSRPVIATLAEKYPLVLVSNFYGNVDAVLRGMDIRQYFAGIIESAVVGIRKPDARIYALGVMALPVTEQARTAGDTCDIFGHGSGAWLRPESVLVVGDSLSKDIYPARSIGCRTAWIKGRGWTAAEDEASDPAFIPSLSALMP